VRNRSGSGDLLALLDTEAFEHEVAVRVTHEREGHGMQAQRLHHYAAQHRHFLERLFGETAMSPELPVDLFAHAGDDLRMLEQLIDRVCDRVRDRVEACLVGHQREHRRVVRRQKARALALHHRIDHILGTIR